MEKPFPALALLSVRPFFPVRREFAGSANGASNPASELFYRERSFDRSRRFSFSVGNPSRKKLEIAFPVCYNNRGDSVGALFFVLIEKTKRTAARKKEKLWKEPSHFKILLSGTKSPS